jgi:hypothetical protein
MSNMDEFRKVLEEIHKENPDTERLNTWFMGTIAATTTAILDILEEMNNGDKL